IAALLVVTAYSAWDVRRLEKEIRVVNERSASEGRERDRLQQALAAAKLEARILMDPKSKKIPMPPQSPDMPQLQAVWHPELGICVMGEKVPMPAKNRVLQLWLIPRAPGSKPMPSRLTWPDKDGKLDLLVEMPPQIMAETKALAITEEPPGGSPQPTS